MCKRDVIAVIGLGYVGLPLAVEFSKQQEVVGYDINEQRILELTAGKDSTLECTKEELLSGKNLTFTSSIEEIKKCNIYIITVPTPVNEHKQPDLTPLVKASELVGKVICRNDIVIYESTVYPGATEEECIPVVECISGLKFNEDFFAGYSPERINPGDKQNRLVNIKKVTAGSTPEIATFVDNLYKSIIEAGTFMASTIKVAEAAKVIENTQRDLNIALINELSIIFNKLDIDTEEVLEAAGSKWNFLPFKPGLVGGHCIGVDPYYLTHKAQSVGYFPDIILSGRRINDGMGNFIVSQVVRLMIEKDIAVKKSNVLLLGLAFKENCPDIRNTKVIDLKNEFEKYGAKVDIYDPWVDGEVAIKEYSIKLLTELNENSYDAIVLAVAHSQFIEMGASAIRMLGKKTSVLYDVKYALPKAEVDGRL